MDVALRFLASRIRSEAQVRERLSVKGVAPMEIEVTISRLLELGYVNDAEFASTVIRFRRQHRARGRRYVLEELRTNGVSEAVADEELMMTYGDEIEVARLVGRKQASKLADLSFRVFRQRLGVFLLRRGFEHATAESLVTELWEEFGAPD
jgi:regulatory protein